MSTATHRLVLLLTAALATTALLQSPVLHAQESRLHANARAVIDHWTPARLAAAIPRDLVIDERGLGYLRRPDGSLVPYGHREAALPSAAADRRKGKPGGGDQDTTPPSIDGMIPADGSTAGTSQQFSAIVTDASGIKSVDFIITYPSGTTQAFRPAYTGNDVWSMQLNDFTDGNWGWRVVAKDNGPKGGTTATSPLASFTVGSGSVDDGGGDGSTITNAPWTAGGAVQTAAGRIYFEMPSNPKWKRWTGYVCSGTVATDDTSGRSTIITAAHCVYDDSNKAFARNVLFIPNQDATTGTRTDLNCDNDPLGCWTPAFGVVDVDWTGNTFPDNIEWDYAFYVVSDTGAHTGTAAGSDILDTAAGSLGVQFQTPVLSDVTHALGYSYSYDPYFMYCAEEMTIEGAVNWWLPSCELSGGSSGGPWVQPMDVETGNGPIISVNSWGYTTAPGMAGPRLDVTTAGCLFDRAKSADFASIPATDGNAGIVGCW